MFLYTRIVLTPSELLLQARLVLLDIDGTLLHYGNGVHGRAIIAACNEITGSDVAQHFPRISAGGRTDRYIINELLRLGGVAHDQLDQLFGRIAERSIELTNAGLTEPNPGWVTPGTHDVLSALRRSQTPIGLVTGNLPTIAEMKLQCAGVWGHFESQAPLITGYGDLSEDRNDLSRSALRDARTRLDPTIEGDQVVIVGDTPRDVECAHAIGARCLGVTTGRFTADELRAAGAVHIVNTLEEALS